MANEIKKFYIIPKTEIAMEVYAKDKGDAMESFAFDMDLDMNSYFMAVTEEQYREYKQVKEDEIIKNHLMDFFYNEIINEITPDEHTARQIAANAYKIWCKTGSYPYCDIVTEYDAIERANKEYIIG